MNDKSFRMNGLEKSFSFDLSGGLLCLDFANTVSDRSSGRENEHLRRFLDLVSFAKQVGLISEEQAWRLVSSANRHPKDAATVLEQAIALRESIYRLFSDVAGGRQARDEDLATLNRALSESLKRLRVQRQSRRFEWAWQDQSEALDQMLWPVARSAAELLTSEELSAVRECAAETCGWLFLDRSRNQSRRWCDMKVCGNRSKARRHYQRSRGTL